MNASGTCTSRFDRSAQSKTKTPCPRPSLPKACTSQGGTPDCDDPEDDPEDDQAPKRRKQTCGICNQQGHDKQSCQNS